ncbi:MAG: dicarboxylate/amino acid:cation symporter [Gemmatimonadaceae bacterium]
MRLRPTIANLTLAALLGGIVFGNVAPSLAGHLGFLARLFVRLLQMLVAPLVFSTLAAGIGGSAGILSLRRLATGAVVFFGTATLVASIVGLAAGNLLLPFVPIAPPAGIGPAPVSAVARESFGEMLIPSSIVRAMADNNLLAVVFFTVLFAMALRTLRDDTGAPLVRLLESVSAVMVRLASGLMWTAPVAVFAASAAVVATSGSAGLRTFLTLVVAAYVALAGFAVLMLLVSSRIGRFGAVAFVRALAGALLLAFSTASGAAALPGAMEELERWGASRRTISFVLPLGYSFNLTGTALYLPLVTLFWARLNGVTLGWDQQAVLLAMVFALIRGIPPIPRGLFLVWGGLLAQLHLPPEGLVIMLAIDPLLDMARTFVNVEGNCLAVVTLDRFAAPGGAPA